MNEVRSTVLRLMPELERRGRSFVPTADLFGTAGVDRDEAGQAWIDVLWELCDDGLLIAVADPMAQGAAGVSVGWG